MASATNGSAPANGDAMKMPLLSADHLEAAAETAGQQLALKPVKPLALAWRDVTLTIPLKKKHGRHSGSNTGENAMQEEPQTKEILHKSSGEAPAGAVTAIMGPTGSGKSSLLNALAGRVAFVKGARLEGQVFVNGCGIDYALMPKICAYVVQDDVLFAFLTVRETLTLAAHFHLPPSMGEEEKAAYVTEVINALGLAKAANTIIGDERVRGVSGGERKRVSVGVELIANPSLLFLDEPTSGLDSFQALSVMGAMRALARSGRTVVAAIHQPRSSIYDLLDSLVLVSEGRIVYAGPASQAAAHFAGQGLECPANFCPSDFFLDMISMDYRSPELEQATRARIGSLAAAWASAHSSEDGEGEMKDERVANGGGGDGGLGGVVVGRGREEVYKASWGSQFARLFARSFKQARRNKFVLVVKTLSSVFFALILGALYSKRTGDPPTQAAVQNFIGALFFVATNQAFGNLQSVISTFPLEKHIVQKERAANSYTLSAYFLSKLVAELPITLLGPLLFSCTAYFIVGLRADFIRFVIFVAVCMLEAVCAVSLGLLISAFAPDVPSATALAPPVTIVFMLVGGVFINVQSLPQGAQWLPYTSFIKWAFNALAINQFEGMTFACEDAGNKGCVTTGEQVLRLYAMDQYSIGQCALAMVGITAAFTALGYVVLKINSRKYLGMKPSVAAAAAGSNGSSMV